MAIGLLAAGSAYIQNFDTLSNATGSTTNDLLNIGWALIETGGGALANNLYAVGNGSSNTGDTYSFGTSSSTERALGSLQSGTVIPVFGANFVNSTGVTLTSLLLNYIGEQWRLGSTGRADRLDFQYSLDAISLSTGTWMDVDALDFSSPFTTIVGAVDGNSAANRTVISHAIGGLSIAVGAQFWIRWNSFDAAAADDGLAVDDLSLTPVSVTAGNDINSANENVAITGASVFGNDVSLGGPALTVVAVNGIAGNVGNQITLASGALLTLRANGTYDYNPNGRFNALNDGTSGAVNTNANDNFTYTLSGGPTATVTITINGVASADDILLGNALANTITGTAGGDSIVGLDGNDSLIGLGGSDTLNGSAGNDTLAGGIGGDSLDGGADYDFASFIGATGGVTARLDFSSLNTGEAAGDSYTSIEGLIGSQFSDFLLVGDGQANYIAALGGDDYAAGEAGNDTILGGEGNDQFWGGTGADSLDGGNGYDIARYDFAASGVVARLDGGANAGEAAGDTYANIEALYGSAFGDYLIGNSAGNVLAASAAPTCSTGLAATTSCWAVVALTLSLSTPLALARTRCRTSPPRLRQAPTTTMSTSAASRRCPPSSSRRSVPIRISSPTTAPSSCRASQPRRWSRGTSCSEAAPRLA